MLFMFFCIGVIILAIPVLFALAAFTTCLSIDNAIRNYQGRPPTTATEVLTRKPMSIWRMLSWVMTFFLLFMILRCI